MPVNPSPGASGPSSGLCGCLHSLLHLPPTHTHAELKINLKNKTKNTGAREMVHQLTLAALPENQGLNPSTHMVALTLFSSSSRGSMAFLALMGTYIHVGKTPNT